VPLQPSREQTFLVRTVSSNPLVLAGFLRRDVSAFQPAFRVSNIRRQQELVQGQTVRERLLATLALFFAAVALLAGIGLYASLVTRFCSSGVRSESESHRRAVGEYRTACGR
jgi:hypothetical protein